MTGRLTGKTAVVTGSGRGIGLAIAIRYGQEGANVVVVDIDEATAQSGAAAVRQIGRGRAVSVPADVGVATDVDRVFETAIAEFGTVDVLVNNAALNYPQVHLLDADEAWWDRYIRTNLTGQYLCLDRAARIMARARAGAIINVSSVGAAQAHRGMVAYDAAKGGVEAMTRAAALDLAPYGVRVNTLVPGLIATNPSESSESLRRRDRTVPLGRGGVAAELAGPAVFLASDDAAYVTGSRLVVDGGVLAQLRSPQVDTLPPERFPEA